MTRNRTYKRITKDERVEVAEAEAVALRAGALQHELTVAQLEAIPSGDRNEAWQEERDAAAKQIADDEKRAKAVQSHAAALRGKPLSRKEKADQKQAVVQKQIEDLKTNLRSWEAAADGHERNIEKAKAVGDDPAQDESDLEKIDRAIAAGEARLEELKGQAPEPEGDPEPPA